MVMLRLLAGMGLAVLCNYALCDSKQPVTIQDAISMVRIDGANNANGSVGAFSPDGSKFATVVWHGDLQRNTNVYRLLLFRVNGNHVELPTTVVTRDFPGDPRDANASAIQNLQFLSDNKTVVFLGQTTGQPAQMFAVDTSVGNVRQLTHSPTDVRSAVVDRHGRLKMYSAVAVSDVEIARQQKLDSDGAFLWDDQVFVQRSHAVKAFPALLTEPQLVRQYFLARDKQRKLVFDSRAGRSNEPLDLANPEVASAPTLGLEEEMALQGWASLTGDHAGSHALIFPYGLSEHPMRPDRYIYYRTGRMNAYGRRMAAPYGLVDLNTGNIERLIDAPHPQFDGVMGGGEPLWAPDGKSVIIYTLLPLDGDNGGFQKASEAPPQWCEVTIAGRRIVPLGIPEGWKVLRWDTGGDALILSKGAEIAEFKKTAAGRWGQLKPMGSIIGFSPAFSPTTNGRLVMGVRESFTTPPEVVSFDLTSGRTQTITNLNPELHRKRYAEVEVVRWKQPREDNAWGFLIKPHDLPPRKRAPLIVLLDDGTLAGQSEPYLLDAVIQLSGFCIQPTANHGIAVLYLSEPASLRSVVGTPEEGRQMLEHIESAVAELDRRGVIDPSRIGLSGWSRAGYYTNYSILHARIPFRAASQIDGGGLEYTEGLRPYLDAELNRVRTPLLLEAHGPFTLTLLSAMSERMDALGKPVETLYFKNAPHQTVRPQHRKRSLEVHLDWWRFWLLNEQDTSPEKATQYARWHTLRQMLHDMGAKTSAR
jgi:dienelactone hydrolase